MFTHFVLVPPLCRKLFLHEPLAGKEVVRGIIPTEPPTPFLRNISDNVLYLNTEHRPDFVDGKLAAYRSFYRGHVIFTNLQLSSVRGDLTIPYTVDLYTYEHACAGWLEVNSGWTGDLEVNGQKWRLGLVDNLDGQLDNEDILYLRRVDRQEAQRIQFKPPPKTLFLDGKTFDLAFVFRSGPTRAVIEASLTERQPVLGQLKLQARGCRYLCLRSGDLAVVLDASKGTLPLPAGTYQIADCLLEQEPDQSMPATLVRCDTKVSVEPGQTASLAVGLPLKNSLAVTRDRNLLRLTYQLLGAAGEQYEYYNWRDRPTFSVFKGPIRIGTGALPYG